VTHSNFLYFVAFRCTFPVTSFAVCILKKKRTKQNKTKQNKQKPEEQNWVEIQWVCVSPVTPTTPTRAQEISQEKKRRGSAEQGDVNLVGALGV
jgi:hypothetical protein